MDATSWLLLVLFFAVALLDWVAVHLPSKPLEYLAKPGCMVLLIAAAAAMDPADGAARGALLAALALSTLGDVFLVLPGGRANLFVAGLGSFLLAHVAYVVGFGLEGLELDGALVGVVPVVLLVALVGRRVRSAVRSGEEPELAAPVSAYIGVIALMVLAAFATTDGRAMVGAALFAGSDSLIAWERFVRRRPWVPVTIMVTYHLAQVLLVLSFT